MANATYTKLRDGSWGIRATIRVSAGDRIQVTKKSGENKTETIGNVPWSGNGVVLCTIAAGHSHGHRSHRRVCSYCGSFNCSRANNPSALCDED